MKNLVIFKAKWCQPCQMMSKSLEGVQLPIPVSYIDVDERPDVLIEYGIRGVPTSVLIEDNIVIARKSGYMSNDELLKFVA